MFALSSRYEPLRMTAVEAMACGTPSVITTQGGLWQMVRWGVDAVSADPFDPEAYGHAIAAVLGHPRVAAPLSAAGSEVARARFTWTGITQRLLAVLDLRWGRPTSRGRRPASPPLAPSAAPARWATSTPPWITLGS